MEDNWIKVSDRLPEQGERVLTYISPEFNICISKLEFDEDCGGYYWVDDDGDSHKVSVVTRWQPLPEPPK